MSEADPKKLSDLYDPNTVVLLGELYSRWFDNILKISQEIVEVTQNRMQKDITAWTKLASCRDTNDLMECQRNLTEELTVHFAEDILKLSRMVADITGNSVTALRPTRAVH